MSSIERYIDKLGDSVGAGQPPRDLGVGELPDSSDLKADISREAKVTQQEVAIDFGWLQDSGMLTPDTREGRLVDEYRAIKRPLLKNAFGKGVTDVPNGNLIMVTSALPDEGKSFTAINLAMSMAMERDRTVLLVEADVAKPAVCNYCGIAEPEQGLVDYLADPTLDLSDLLLKTNVPKLTVLPAGQRHTSSVELLGSQSMNDLMSQLANRYMDRIVIFDSPPLLLSNEAVTLSSQMGQIVVVVEAAKTQQLLVKQAIALLDSELIVGVVLNKSRSTESHGYGYGYGAAGRGG